MQKIEIHAKRHILIDNARSGLAVTQDQRGTILYTVESKFSGTTYKEHSLPHSRYSLCIDNPASGCAGRSDFERDLISLIKSPDFLL